MVIKKINLIFVTFFGVGYIKIASGTFASLVISIIFFYLFRLYISIEHFLILCLIMILVFTYSLYAIKTVENEFEQKDARQIVIDEVIGQSIPILLIEYIAYLKTQSFGADLYLYVASFFLFRFFLPMADEIIVNSYDFKKQMDREFNLETKLILNPLLESFYSASQASKPFNYPLIHLQLKGTD